MKKQFVSSNTRASIIRFGAAVLLFINLSQASASPVFKGDDPYVNIKYVGLVENRAQFQVDLVNDLQENYLLQIADASGTILYKEKIDKKTFSKKFEWDNVDLSASKLIFSVTGLKSKKTQSFEVNTAVRTVQDVVISKM
ncbi:MAG TPA: hypothetical protein VEX65_13830 [Flavisolibacter sp.]|nr:hypothetical protein [Flavisolibacter sp.]